MPKPTFDILESLVQRVTCKPGWEFRLGRVAWSDALDVSSFELLILITVPDSRSEHPQGMTIAHHFPVPMATYNEKAWRRWIFECCRKVEDHELGEWFLDGNERPFAPLHAPGENPYDVHEFRDVVDARTNQDGTVRP